MCNLEKEDCAQLTELTVVEPKAMQLETTMWNDTGRFNDTYKMAQIVAGTDIVPVAYKGKVGNCLLAIDVANRMGLSPMAVMQNSQIVQGRFSWSGCACKSMIDSCGKYVKTRYVEVGEKGTNEWGVYLEATDKDGEIIKGATVTIQMAKDEGWYGKPGSKWKTMPELMARYRAAAFFMRTECASLSMGFLTAEENEDIYGTTSTKKTHLKNLLNEEEE